MRWHLCFQVAILANASVLPVAAASLLYGWGYVEMMCVEFVVYKYIVSFLAIGFQSQVCSQESGAALLGGGGGDESHGCRVLRDVLTWSACPPELCWFEGAGCRV